MAKQAVYQVRMDEDIKDQVEALYRGLGTTFAEAVRIFAVQSIREQGMPFTPSEVRGKTFGALSRYADPALRSQEDTAFEKAMVASGVEEIMKLAVEKNMTREEIDELCRKKYEEEQRNKAAKDKNTKPSADTAKKP